MNKNIIKIKSKSEHNFVPIDEEDSVSIYIRKSRYDKLVIEPSFERNGWVISKAKEADIAKEITFIPYE
jgi:hypothetical protein